MPSSFVPYVKISSIPPLGIEYAYRACTNIPHHTSVYHIVQRSHNLLSWYLPIQSMDLQHVDICTEPFHAGLHGIKDVFSRQSNSVYLFAIVCETLVQGSLFSSVQFIVHSAMTLCHNDYSVAWDLVLDQRFPQYLLGNAVGIRVRLFFTNS